MATNDIILTIDKPFFIVKLQKYLLEVDLKEGAMKELEDVLEANPVLRENLGFFFQTVIPLDVPLKDVEDLSADENGTVKIVIPLRRDITIPLDLEEAERLVTKLQELIPLAKQRYYDRLLASQKAEREAEIQRWRSATFRRF